MNPTFQVQQTTAEPERPLIAVRPFRSLSADPQQGYFAAGMTEEIRGQLSQVSALRILGSAGLDGYGDDLPRVARELGHRSFVAGSVRVEGSRVRVSAELVDARTRESLWSQQYDRELAGVLAVQSDIAQQIAHRSDICRSPGACGLSARVHGLLRRPFVDGQGDCRGRSGAAHRPGARVRVLHPRNGYAIKGQGARSRQAFLRALELNPSGGGLLSNFSIAEMLYGRLDEAVYLGRRGFMLSGKRGFYHLIMPMVTIRADAESRILLEEAERRTPTDARVQMMLGMLELFEGSTDKALARSEAIAEREPKNVEMAFHRSDVAYLADSPELESLLAPLLEHSPTNRLWCGESVRLRYATRPYSRAARVAIAHRSHARVVKTRRHTVRRDLQSHLE